MKKTLLVALAMLLTLSFTGMVYAQASGEPEQIAWEAAFGKAKVMKFEGEVLSHDVKCHCFVIKTAKGTLTLQDDYAKFKDDYNRAKGLKIGAKAKGEYKTVNGINYATTIDQ